MIYAYDIHMLVTWYSSDLRIILIWYWSCVMLGQHSGVAAVQLLCFVARAMPARVRIFYMIYIGIWWTYSFDNHTVSIWYFFVFWFLSNVCMMFIWYSYDIHLLHMVFIWYSCDMHMVYFMIFVWCSYDIDLILIWYSRGIGPVRCLWALWSHTIVQLLYCRTSIARARGRFPYKCDIHMRWYMYT